MNTWQVLKQGLALTADGYRQLAFIKSFLTPIIQKHCTRLGFSLSASEKKKVLFYYPMYTVLACAQMYVALKGRRLSHEETQRLTLVGAMATLCDDLVDEDHWTREQVLELLYDHLDVRTLAPKAALLVALNKELQSFWPLTEKYKHQLRIALEWQSASGKQMDANISLEEIVHLCREKNGNTSLMFATLLDEEWTEAELKFIYQSAIVGQLTNDSFDMYFDTHNGVQTYFNTAPAIAQVRNFFIEECNRLHGYVLACDAKPKHQLNTIRRMSILHAFTLTALDQFEETEKKYGRPIDWKALPRKDLVIDMALNRNRFKTVRYMKWLSRYPVKY